MKHALPLLALLVLPLVGCESSGAAAKATNAPAGPAGLSADLKNDAYEYYGLGNDKPVRLEVTTAEGAMPQVGTRTFKFEKMDGDKATFIQKHEGALQAQGDITLSLEKDGIYVMSSSNSKIKPHTLEIPATLEPGGGWKDRTEMTQQDKKIVLDNDLKVVRKERIATKGGTFDDALYITSTGKGTIDGQPVTLNTQHWYVRGMGPVKQVLEIQSKGEPKRVTTIQLAAPEKAEAGAVGEATK